MPIAATKLYPEFDENERSLPILPWAHSYGQTADLYAFIRLGASMGLAESLNTIAEDLGKVKPTFLIAVPRIFNRVYDGLWARMNEEGRGGKKIVCHGCGERKEKKSACRKRRIERLDESEIQDCRQDCFFQKSGRASAAVSRAPSRQVP